MTKDRLRRYRDLSRERHQLENQLKGIAVTMAALRPHAPMQRLDSMSQRVSAVLQTKLDKLMEDQIEIETALEALEPKARLVMRAYYIDGRKWDDVCLAVGYERSQVFKIHAAALKKLEG